MTTGIDCSNWGGVPTLEQARCMRSSGVEFAIVGTQNEAIADGQLTNLIVAGIRCELYLYPYYNDGDAARVARAIRLAKKFGLLRIWDDVEWHPPDGPQPSAAVVAAGIGDRLRAYRSEGIEAGIYTSETQWPAMTGGRLDGVIKPADTPLWNAFYYFDRHVPLFSSFRPYGPWKECLAWQYHDTTTVCDFSVDLNIWNPTARVVKAPRPDDVPMSNDGLTDEEREELGERRALAELHLALLLKYRTQPRPGGKVELVTLDEAPLDPRIIIDVRR